MKRKLILFSLIIGSSYFSKGQELVAPSGGHYEIPSVSSTFSLGEPIIGFAASDEHFVNQGFLQPHKPISSVGITEQGTTRFSVYPNPVSSITTVQASDGEQLKSYSLYSSIGENVLNVKNINENTVVLDLSQLAPGIYFLNVTNTSDKKQTVKIHKQ